MRWIAIPLNIVLLIMLSVTFYHKGGPSSGEIFLVGLAFAAPVFSLLALFLNRGKPNENLISLYLRRKRLEEEKRISDLRK